MTIWMAFRIGIAVIALLALIALFVCQYRLSSRVSCPVSRRGPVRSGPDGDGLQSSDVANWN
ncbi:hypothetical protein [Cupriavidus sp. D384]|uniref:hypothetical protein n=1 Tax=Cupriavidus sp. D384 TaxID=1538095 RepID=UPI000830BAB5|nr:hypothetical protein [Cupriavidus sp. D384]